ncbi:hypothetical protein P1X14_00825 [Sphingomonas sp. AOB5]|uniref:hypothetical protein n=1 Tax=Sphingomonas sp. AOB5 TaxID=3034017 RepID=UPI0023F86F64|nr:hypothetical protein [Sphingomonas sp. AOB5]MDF7773775.1 hypothetical protein [Sphingomonas sp. AOB5]
MRVPASYQGLLGALSRYWSDYGGWKDLLSSPLFHFSVLVSGASYSAWLRPDWIELPLSLLPNLLGFSLGAYALIFSLADERLLAALNAPTTDGSPTVLRMVNATFLHFILIQTAAIVFAIMNKSTLLIDIIGVLPFSPYWATVLNRLLTGFAGLVGYFLTVYAIVLLIGAALAAYRLAIMSGRAAAIAQQTPITQPVQPLTPAQGQQE